MQRSWTVALSSLLIVTLTVVAWRIAVVPVRLEFLRGWIADALSRTAVGLRAEVGVAELAWAGWRHGVVVEARDVRLVGTSGAVVASVPSVRCRLALAPLLRGTVALRAIEIVAPSLQLVRERDGHIVLVVGGEGRDRSGAALPPDAIDALLARDRPGATLSFLQHLDLRDGELTVEDRASAATFRASAVTLGVERTTRGLELDATAEARLGERATDLDVTGVLDATTRALDVTVAFRGFDPAAAVAALRPAGRAPEGGGNAPDEAPGAWALLAGLSAVLDGTVHVGLDAALRVERARLDAVAASGSVMLPGSKDAPLPIDGAHLVASVDPAADTVVVERLSVVLGRASTRIEGGLEIEARLEGLGAPRALVASATLHDLPVDALARYWPSQVVPAARKWFTTNVTDGRVTRAEVRLALAAREAEVPAADARSAQHGSPRSLGIENLTGTFAYEDLSVRYIDTMPSATDVRGEGTFTTERWDLGVAAGKIEGIAIGSAKVAITAVGSREPRITIAADVVGPFAGALAVLEHEPIGAAHAINIDPETVSGTLAGHLDLDFPPRGRLAFGDLGLRATARLSEVVVPRAVRDWPLADGDLRLVLDGRALELGGRLRLAGVPLEATWRETLATDVGPRRMVVVRGRVDSDGRAALGYDFRAWLDGAIETELSLTQSADGSGRADLQLDLTPARLTIPSLGVSKPPGVGGRADAAFALEGAGIAAIERLDLRTDGTGMRMHGRASRDARSWKTIALEGALGAAAKESEQDDFALALDRNDRGYALHLTSQRAGSLIKGVGFSTEARGGRLDASGSVGTEANHTFDVGVSVANLTVTRAAVLARILTLGSLKGIERTLTSQGVLFRRIEAKLTGDDRQMTLVDGVAVADSIGITLAGTLDRDAGTAALRGTVVPAYYGVNPVFGKMPVLGSVLAGKHGLGVGGIDFSLSGPLADPRVTIRPVDTVTPEVVRSLGRILEGGASSGVRPRSRGGH